MDTHKLNKQQPFLFNADCLKCRKVGHFVDLKIIVYKSEVMISAYKNNHSYYVTCVETGFSVLTFVSNHEK
jgi:environmental stress-induced protein Ves